MKDLYQSSIKTTYTKWGYCLILILLFQSYRGLAQEGNIDWPKEIVSGDYIITIYAPENSSYVDLRLDTNTAFSVKKGLEGTPVFGMMWTTSLLNVDRTSRIASLVSIKVNEVRFPDDVSEENRNQFKGLIEREVPKWDIQISLDDLLESIEEVSTYDASLNTSPPKILFSSVPAVLISIDGAPQFKQVDDQFEVIQNSSGFIAKDKQKGTFYLQGGEFWYEANDPLGPWAHIKKAPSAIRKLAKMAISETEPSNSEDSYNGEAPRIVIATEPSELILIDGEPSFAPIQNTNLLFVENSDDNLFMHIKDQTYYILLSGRWFTSKNTTGPWNFIDSEDLPNDFKNIGEGSKKAEVLANVAGTKEAQEAIYDTQIPQTAAIDRTTQPTGVTYNGTPEFEKIKGLELEYALNTQSSVFKDKSTYYLCDNAIWFKSSGPQGPWEVASERPEEVSKIPPENPKYNTKYVYIYETTPSVVYVGYTPSYYGSYVYRNTVFYGTGYYYNPWYHGFYYRHHFTYGFSVRYNPWYGWTFGFRFGSPFRWWGYGYWGRWNYWGPPYYRPPYYRPGYRPRPSRPIYRDRRGVTRYQRPTPRPTTRPSTRPISPSRPTARPSTRPTARPTAPTTRPSTRPSTRPNIPYTRPSTRPSVRPANPSNPSTRPSNRPQTRPTAPMSRPAARPTRPIAPPARNQSNRSGGNRRGNQ